MDNQVLRAGYGRELKANEQELESDVLRAAGILRKGTSMCFILDNEPASCNVHLLLPQRNFKMLSPKQPGNKQTSILTDTPALSLTLGWDALPQHLLSPRCYLTHSLTVLSKHQGMLTFYACKQQDNFSTQHLESLHDKLGLRFQALSIEAANGKKRARTGKSGPVNNCSLLSSATLNP